MAHTPMSPIWAMFEAGEHYLNPYLEQILLGGNTRGQTACIAWFLRTYPKGKVMVQDIANLDKLVAQGVQPSQIMVSSEFKNTSRFDMGAY